MTNTPYKATSWNDHHGILSCVSTSLYSTWKRSPVDTAQPTEASLGSAQAVNQSVIKS